ncbi:MAG: tetratricopeptide repeat protein, partial [Planctomycetaceae bacterium]|nr:tetratricopeptide repeat protein [Planctomycetaceae bacterium]
LDGLATAYRSLGDVWDNLSYTKGWGVRNRGNQLRQQLEKEFPDYESPDRIRSLIVELDFPTDASLPHDVNELRRMESELKEQLALVEKSVRDHPAMPVHQIHLNQILRRLGMVLAAQQRHEEQEPYTQRRVAIAQELVERFPQVPGLRQNLAWASAQYAWLLRVLGRNDEAEQHFEEAIAIMDELVKHYPESSKWMAHLADMLQHIPVQRLQDPDRIISLLQRAIELNGDGRAELGLAFALAERYEEAQEWLDEAMKSNPNAIDLVPTQAILLWHAGKQEESHALLERVIQQLYSTPNKYWYQPGYIYTAQKIANLIGLEVPQLNVGATDGAEATDAALEAEAPANTPASIEELTTQIEERPNNPQAWLKRGRAYRERGQLEQALADFTKGIELLPDTDGKGWPLGEKASLLVRMGQWEAAQELYAEAFPRLVKGAALDHNGYYYFYQGAILDAFLKKPEQHHQIVSDMWGHYGEATTPVVIVRVAIATLLTPEIVDPVEVREALDRLEENAQKYDSLAGRYPLTLGMAEYRSGRYVEAIRRLQSSRAANKSNSLIDSVSHFYEAMAQHQLGRPLAARSAYDAGFDIFTTKVPKVDGSQLPRDWHDVLVCHMSQREAEALLKAQDTDEYLARGVTQLEEQRKLIQETPNDLALQAQLGACLRTMG